MALSACVDCGTQLGRGAASCPKCRSNDPDGSQRETQKFGFFMVGMVILIFGMSWFLFQVSPVDLIMKIWQLWK
jgi:RNA polymerase subunit RPABC4/transcription elongation factor Spt4